MNKLSVVISLLILLFHQSNAQQQASYFTDSTHQLAEVVVAVQQKATNKKIKVLSSLDNYLENNNAINMVKRGAYAWEALINGMASERSVITIDGMRIYSACTDKMDPVTSYVEITNLSKAVIHSGQAGGANGSTIGGGIDLIRAKIDTNKLGVNASIFTGFESTNQQKIIGTSMQYAEKKFYTLLDFTYRNAQNYKAGNNIEIPFSQFTKYNLSATAGWKINHQKQIIASVIYDDARNVGYPALPMDVAFAKAFIGSVQYEYHNSKSTLYHWETKLYFNSVTHLMDDTKRPNVPVHMDMPGWANTAGFYSKLEGKMNNHNFLINLNAHYNTSLAEMTMYSKNSNEKDMFMLTWPGVHTIFGKLFVEDKIDLNKNWSANISAGLSINNNTIKNELGLTSLQIFYPNLLASKTRLLKNIAGKINYRKNQWQQSFGVGFGERAPSISEGYGFYLFNSFDRYDYIGNPTLKNEKSLEINSSTSYNTKNLSIHFQADYFRIFNYIIGMPNHNFIPMTIGANGVKVYQQLPYANILNLSLSSTFRFTKSLQIAGKMVYRKGNYESLNLPQIQPISYGSTIRYQHKNFIAECTVEGALKHTNFSPTFGETGTDDYTILNLSASKQIKIFNQTVQIKTGFENLFDRYYSTFADWNKIPRNGRNFFINVVYNF